MKMAWVSLGTAAVLASFGSAVQAAETNIVQAAESSAPHQPESYMRVRSAEGGIRVMETATRTFRPAAGPGPEIRLVGVTHIGDAAYYTAIQRALDSSSLVLFEGVGRPDFVTLSPQTDAERETWNESALEYLAELYQWHQETQNAWPADMTALAAVVRTKRNREQSWVGLAKQDGWGRAWELDLESKPARIGSLGSDGAPGGDGTARDVWKSIEDSEDDSGIGDIQSSIAEALGLSYQLDAIHYDREHFRNSDMALGQIRSAMESAGGSGQEQQLMRMLEGAPELGPLLQGLMRMVSSSPQLQALVRALMIESLAASESLLEQSANGAGPIGRLIKVLIADRNQVVLQDLRRALEAPSGITSVALFYGAGHMSDLESALVRDLGYRPAETEWHSAFSVRLADTGLTEGQWEAMRNLLQTQMRQATAAFPP
ncbi:MAG: type II secretion system protein GspG [Kiritimatiellae bacterium]|nr:type II secretion system protein GspG [Kiritimatiellia bacterium]